MKTSFNKRGYCWVHQPIIWRIAMNYLLSSNIKLPLAPLIVLTMIICHNVSLFIPDYSRTISFRNLINAFKNHLFCNYLISHKSEQKLRSRSIQCLSKQKNAWTCEASWFINFFLCLKSDSLFLSLMDRNNRITWTTPVTLRNLVHYS